MYVNLSNDLWPWMGLYPPRSIDKAPHLFQRLSQLLSYGLNCKKLLLRGPFPRSLGMEQV
jgi:hypothetical protein